VTVMIDARTPRKELGVGIIEVMVSIALGLFILAGVLQLYATTTQNASVVNGSSVIQENARYVFSRMEKDIAQAGYAGCSSYSAGKGVVSLLDADYANTIAFDAEQFISGSDDVAVNSQTFDSFTVRYANNAESSRVLVSDHSARTFTVNNYDNYESGDLVFVSDCNTTGVFRISNNPASDGFIAYAQVQDYNSGDNFFGLGFVGASENPPPGQPLAFLYGKGAAVRYFVDTSAAGQTQGGCSTAHPEFCALFREVNGQSRELVEGVESFEVEYGLRNANGELLLKPANTLTAAEWGLVDRVRIVARLNSIDRTPINDGVSDRLARDYSRTFFLFNQIPGA